MLAITLSALAVVAVAFMISGGIYILRYCLYVKKLKNNESNAKEKEKTIDKPGKDFMIAAPLTLGTIFIMVALIVSVCVGSSPSKRTPVSTETKEIVLNEEGYPVITNFKKNDGNFWGVQEYNPYIASMDILDKNSMSFVNIRIKDRTCVVFDQTDKAYYEKRDMDYTSPIMKAYALEEPADEYILHLPKSMLEEIHIDENVKVFLEE